MYPLPQGSRCTKCCGNEGGRVLGVTSKRKQAENQAIGLQAVVLI